MSETTEQIIYRRTLAQRGTAAVVLNGMVDCGALLAALPQHFFAEALPASALAEQIAALEISLGLLRQAIGEPLVDLAKVERLSAMHYQLED